MAFISYMFMHLNNLALINEHTVQYSDNQCIENQELIYANLLDQRSITKVPLKRKEETWKERRKDRKELKKPCVLLLLND